MFRMTSLLLACVASGLSNHAMGSVVGYWNFNNMQVISPGNDAAVPGIESSLPGPTGLFSYNGFSNPASGPQYQGFRLEYGHPSFGVQAPNGLNALNGDPDGFGLRVGNGAAGFIRNGSSVYFPLASMQTLQNLETSFLLYGGGGYPAYSTVRVLWSTQSSTTGWNLLSTFSPSGGWQLKQFAFGTLLDGVSDPLIAIQFDNGGEYAWAVLDNVQFNATTLPEPGLAGMIGLALASSSIRRRRPIEIGTACRSGQV
jgi:hypothetical protein